MCDLNIQQKGVKIIGKYIPPIVHVFFGGKFECFNGQKKQSPNIEKDTPNTFKFEKKESKPFEFSFQNVIFLL